MNLCAPAMLRGSWKLLLLIFCTGVVSRLPALSFAAIDGGDPVTRTWNGWRWLSNPEIITHGVWGPLHTYLMASAMAVFPDPTISPVLLGILFSAATAALLYLFTQREFGIHHASLFVALTYLFYPIAIRDSLMVTAEAPFVFLVALCWLFLSIARDQGTEGHALLAGIALTLACMLRYEGWLLIPLFGSILFKKRSLFVIFVACALIHPAFWLVGNGIHYGDPLYSVHSASNWELNVEGANEALTTRTILKRAVFYAGATFLGMTPVMATICLIGVAVTVVLRRRSMVWIIPVSGLLIFFTASALQGSLALKTKYTLTLGTLFFPFAAEFWNFAGIEQYSPKQKLLLQLLVIASMLALSFPFRGISPVPRLAQQEEADRISATVNRSLGNDYHSNAGFICDFFGWDNSYYVALMTRLHPDQIFVAPGGRHQQPEITRVSGLLCRFPRGLLLLKPDSRFAHLINFREPNKAIVGGMELSLQVLQIFQLGNSKLTLCRYKTL